MMGIMGVGGAFINAAGQATKSKTNKISLYTLHADPSVASVTGTGDITVSSIKNGVRTKQVYEGGLSEAALSISADANTWVVISGDVTGISIGAGTIDFEEIVINSETLTTGDFGQIQSLKTLRAIHAPLLNMLKTRMSYNVETIDVSGTKAITFVNTNGNHYLTDLDLSEQEGLEILYLNTCHHLKTVEINENAPLREVEIDECFDLEKIEIGNLSQLQIFSAPKCHTLTSINLNGATSLTSVNASYSYLLDEIHLEDTSSLATINLDSCFALQILDLAHATALTSLKLNRCFELHTLDISSCTLLSSIVLTECNDIENIRTHATSSTVATAVANCITSNAHLQGTVYVNSDETYYSTIETAATGAGWTIAPLAA